jgi:hypothetical protein
MLLLALSTASFGQGRASLRGLITDEFGAAIVGATVTLTDAAGTQKTATTTADGTYSFIGLAPGKYKVHAGATGFAASEDAEVDVAVARREPLNISLKIAAIETQVKVTTETPLSTETNNNADQQVLSGKDLDALPDDPDELAAALQALAGPSVGPGGGQIFIDGFSGSNMPPKESIREIRINQNPFSPENDQPSARIDILTRPGTDKFRGGANFSFTDESLDSRNPFAISSSKRSPYQVRRFGGNISGPIIKKKASFFLDLNRNETDDNELVRATILDPSLNIVQLGEGFLVPRRNTNFGPRIDYAINSRNTLIARYNYFHSTTKNNGVNGFSLPSRGYDIASTNQNLQLTETAVINAFTVNETRFQFSHGRSESLGNSSIPTLNVSGSFNGCVGSATGCSQVGHAINQRNNWELNNFTQIQKGMHTFKFGGRVRGVKIDDLSPNNFGGQWVFTGGFGPQLDANNNPVAGTNIALSSIERYRRTLLFSQLGKTPDQIRLLGGGAAQFSINAGNPAASVSQTDIGVYWQDDWRVRPNLTLSYGLRYENQTNISSKFNFAPRFGFAWSPGAANSTKPPKTVIRGGGGIFYNRFSEGSTLTALRFNGANELQYVVAEPAGNISGLTTTDLNQPTARPIYNLLNAFPNVPSVAGVVPATQQTIWQVAPNLQAPSIYLAGVQIEHQLPKNITAFVGFYNVRISHLIRQRDINAPLPGTITATTPNGIRPNTALGDIDEFESSGKMHQERMFVGFNSRLNPNLSLQGSYTLGRTKSDADGGFPVNSYDFTGEWSRASFDIRHSFNLVGTINAPWWKLVFSPFITASSGPPFNITTGQDTNLDRQYNERPTFAALNAICTQFPTRCTGFDYSSTSNQIIPRNYGHAPGSLSVNLTVSRTFGFGGEANRSRAATSQSGDKTAADTNKPRGGGPGGRGGPMIGGGIPAGGGGGKMEVHGGPGGMGGFGGGGGAAKYNLTVALNFQNILNRTNLGAPVGILSSPLFGQSTSVAGRFGGFGGFGGGEGPGAPNRRIFLNLRFTF